MEAEEDLKNFLVIMSENPVGRPSGSTNQPGHSAGGARAGAGRKAANSAPLGTAAPSSIQAPRSTPSSTQINLQSMFIYLILHLTNICNIQILSMRVQLEPLALRVAFIQFLVGFSVRFLNNILISLN